MAVTRYRAALIGLNHYHATGWYDTLADLVPRIEFVALYDPDPHRGESLAPDHHDPNLSPALPAPARDLPFFTALDQLIREARPEIAVVTLPNADAPAAIATLARARVHLMVDKPGAKTAADAAANARAAREAGVKLAVALTRRYGQGWRDAKAMVAAGRLGRLYATEAIFTTSSVAVRDPANLLFSRERMGGGILHWLGVHDLDLLLWLTGERIVEVQAMAGTLSSAPIDVEDVISLALRYETGAIGTAHFAYALPRPGGDGYLALRGAAGSIRLQPDGTLTWLGPGTPEHPVMQQTTTYQMRQAPGYGWAGGAIVSDLLAAIEQDREPLANADAVAAALRVIDAAYASAATGHRVHIDWDRE